MSVLLDINGQEFDYPEVGDTSWGPDATDWAVAVTNGMLQKAGGLFLLLADVDFGSNFGLISKSYSSRTANTASAGQIRLAKTDNLSWRNNANDGDLPLAIDASDKLTFDGVAIQQAEITVSDTSTIDLTLTGADLSADIVTGSIGNSLIDAAAAIAFSKMEVLTASRVLQTSAGGEVEVSSVTATTLSYLDATSSIQTQLDAKQATGNYITALTGDVTASGPGSVPATIGANKVLDSMLRQSAGLSVIGNTTNSTANVSDITAASDGQVLRRSGTAIGFGALSLSTAAAVTGALAIANGGTGQTTKQPAFDALSPLTTKGDLLGFSTVGVRLGVGADGTVLTADSAQTTGLKWGTVLTNPMTTGGDMIYGGSSGVPTRLANGSAGQHLLSAGGTNAPVWTSFNSTVYVDTGNGHGSTNTKVPRFTNTRLNTGSDITYADSATNGSSFTINAAGVYSCTFGAQIGGGAAISAITVNGSALTTNADSITFAQGLRSLAYCGSGATNAIPFSSCAIACAAGDVIRPQDNGGSNSADAHTNFSITRIA